MELFQALLMYIRLTMRSYLSFGAGVAVTLACVGFFGQAAPGQGDLADNAELAKMHKEDQEARAPGKDGKIDWHKMMEGDKIRLARVKEMYKDGIMKTGNDFYHAAMILQHAEVPNDYLLSHDLCVLAIIKGNKQAVWLAAASEDRYLDHSKLPQRFGTQYRSENNGPFKLTPVVDGIADWHRKMMNCPTLEDAKKREAEMNKMFGGGKSGGGGG